MPSFSDLKEKLQDRLSKNSDDSTPDSPNSIGSSASLIDHPTPEPASPSKMAAPTSPTKSISAADDAQSAPGRLGKDSDSLAPSAGAGSIRSAVLEKIDSTPQPRKTQAEFKEAFEGIPADDVLIDAIRCAVSRQVLLQGRLWVSEQNLCFNSNIAGYKTEIVLPWKHIKLIEKQNTAKVIPNAIEVIVNDGMRYFLTSFLNRDQTYQLLETIWTHHRHIDSQPPREETPTIRSEDDNRSQVSYEDEDGVVSGAHSLRLDRAHTDPLSIFAEAAPQVWLVAWRDQAARAQEVQS